MHTNQHLTHIFALHGFLGAPQDWTEFSIIDHALKVEHEELSFWPWSAGFNAAFAGYMGKKILLGYSLGGRLAMHAVLSQPKVWDAAIFISSHPGLQSTKEREKRRADDQKWAERFQNEPWEILMRDWNASPVFAGKSFPLDRQDSEIFRHKLCQQLLNWSLGEQEFLLPRLASAGIPMLFMAGAQDTKYCLLAQEFRDFAKIEIIAEAAHRVPWEQPQSFINKVNQFIEDLS